METAVRPLSPSPAPVRISVAMATYDGEQHIREQLESIVRQDLLPIELVITDDGSTDATLEIVHNFARSAPFPVVVQRNERRLGYSDNFLKAASLCRGDLIAFCDQDDIWMETKLSACSRVFSFPEILLAVHSAQTIAESGIRGSNYPHFKKSQVLRAHCNPFANRPGFAMVVRKELLCIADAGQRPQRIHSHDHWLWFLAASAGRIATIADVLTLYRQHDGNVFGVPQPRSFAVHAKSILGTTEYDDAAKFELECARILTAAAERHPDRAARLRKSARELEFRSQLHRLRTGIYNERTTRRRISGFLRILLLAGYLPDQSRSRLGLSAAMKDLIFIIPGAHRFFSKMTGWRLLS
ncbi:MAG TPA: glycosyltransferase family 2 protein [Silvibacterium sp.]|nr:glycosyltransferase family 2 protein [Silvibacterium sp.]